MNIDIADLVKRLGIDLDELELIVNEVVEHEIRLVLADISDDSRLTYIIVRIGEDNVLRAAKGAVTRWVNNLR